MNPLPSLFHVTATSPAELPDPISIPTEPPPTSHFIHSTYSPTIAFDITTTNKTPPGPPTSSTSQACLPQNSVGEFQNVNMTTETNENSSVGEHPHPATDITAIVTTDRVAALHHRTGSPTVS